MVTKETASLLARPHQPPREPWQTEKLKLGALIANVATEKAENVKTPSKICLKSVDESARNVHALMQTEI